MKRLRLPLRAPAVAVLAAAAALAGCDTLPMWMVVQGRSQITDHRHFDNAPIAASTAPQPWARAPQPLRWPGGVSTEAMEQQAAADGTVALLVAQRGRIVYERYFNGYDAGSVATSFSMAKSVVSLLVGIAIDEGRIAGVDEPVTRHVPELLASDPRFAKITLRHLLSMRSGIAFDEGYGSPFTEAARFYLTPDLKREVARLRIEGEPDRAHAYKSGDTQLLGLVVERAVGMPLAAYAQSRLWQPLGAVHDASWSLDSRAGGVARAFCCLNARAEDYLRIGQLVLQQGQWQGRAIVSRAWLERSTAAQSGLPGDDDAARRNIERPGRPQQAFYAWQWRRRPLPGSQPPQPAPAIYAQGLYGQILLVDPATQTVALRLGQRPGERHWPTWLDEVARLNAAPR